ncbi:MAG TPA: hypothetical protein VNA16_02865 [Abditibacteriaceae bacterium]|nr:hypothetical protein [Abditibacteriaceae bacterium]
MHHKWRFRCVLGAGLTAVAMCGRPALLCADVAPEHVATDSVSLAARTPSSGGGAASGNGASDDAIAESHISLSLRDAPVAHMLSLLSAMTELNFRYATPPDGTITATFNDVPLVPTLTTWLGALGFDLRRAGSDFFVFRNMVRQPLAPDARVAPAAPQTASRSPGSGGAIPSSWQYWSRPAPPSAGWKMPGAAGSLAMELGARARSDAGWRPAAQRIIWEMHPGIAVAIPAHPLPARSGPATPVYLRCLIPLRFVPRGAQLLVEIPAEATLYVNGAPVLQRWKGRRVVDLSRVLAPGHNCLSIQWSRVGLDKGGATATALLRYEWFFAGDSG